LHEVFLIPINAHFTPGDDDILFLITTDPAAANWQVFTHEPGHQRVPASRVGEGQWLHPYHEVEPHEYVWEVGVFGSAPDGTTIIIEPPAPDVAVVVRHPATQSMEPLDFEPHINSHIIPRQGL